ncbi:hypothetical protein ABZ807_04005 [Micromonospora sp. NPDC047548]|uniref:hypothetical protein n=1 Tax=Micromonospora sp. NPDC047548 TaxID=3155624 RepID=UPI0033F77073
MNLRRWSAGVLAAALFVPGLAACKSDSAGSDGTAAASPTPADPKAALVASTSEISKGNFTFSITGGGEFNGSGTVHMPSKSAEMKMVSGQNGADDMSMTMHLVFIETDSWVKLELGGEMADAIPAFKAMKGKYQHIDRAKVKDAKELEFDFADVDPAGSDALIKAVTDVKATGEGAYAGTIDATKATDSDVLDADTLKGLGDKAGALPFTAKLDGQGRLAEFTVQLPAVGDTAAHDLTVKYADYGTAAPVQKPPAKQVVEASDQVYEMFKS